MASRCRRFPSRGESSLRTRAKPHPWRVPEVRAGDPARPRGWPARQHHSSPLVRETATLVDVMGHDLGRAHLPPQRHPPPLLSDVEVQHLGDTDRVHTAADCRPHVGPTVLAGVVGDRGHRQGSGERRAERRHRARRLQRREGTGPTGTIYGHNQRRDDQQRQEQAKEPHDCSSAHRTWR